MLCFAALLAAPGCGNPGSGELPAKDVATAAASASATPTTAASAASTAAAAPAETAAAAAASNEAAGAQATPPGTPPSAKAAVAGSASAQAAAPSASASEAPTVASAAPTASATAAAAAEPALNVQGAQTQEAAFNVWMQSAKSYKVGQAASVEVVVVPKGSFHCNDQYPYKVKMGAAPAGVSFAQDTVRGASVSPARASIRVPFTPTAAGDARISGKFYFSVCNADQCVIDQRDVAATVKIE